MPFDQQLDRAFDTISGLIRAEVSRQVRAVTDELAARLALPGRESDSAIVRLGGGIRAIGDARSLTEVLDTLLTCAGLEASRAAVLLVRGTRLRGWRFIGFGPRHDNPDVVDLDAADGGIIAAAVESASTIVGRGSEALGAPAFATLPPGRPCLAAPLVVGGHAVAVLYADGGIAEPGLLNPEPVEILSRYASRSLEAIVATKAARPLVARADKTSR
jgi:hypothetical protein